MSPSGNVMSPGSHLVSPPSNVMGPPNDLMQRSPMGRRYPAVNTSMPCQGNVNQPLEGHHAVVSQQQHRYYANPYSQIHSNQQYNVNAQMNVHMPNYPHPMGLHQGVPLGYHEPPMPNSYNHPHPNHPYNQPIPNFPSHHHISQNPHSLSQYSDAPTYHSHAPNVYANPSQVGPQDAPLTPRPPSHGASTAAASSRLRLTRMRHNNTVTSQQTHPCPPGPSNCVQTPNCAPDTQVCCSNAFCLRVILRHLDSLFSFV